MNTLPLRTAVIVGDPFVVQRLLLADPAAIKSSLALHACAANEVSEQLVDLLVNLGANVDDVDDDGFSAIHRHVCANRVHGVCTLLSLGAGIDSKDADGNTCLHFAARLRNYDMIVLLLAHGADLNAKNIAGECPKDLCDSSFWDSVTKLHSMR